MGLERDTLALLQRAAARRTPPRVRALHLPPAPPEESPGGAWCALELDDGALGLGYVRGGNTLDALHAHVASAAGADALVLAEGFAAAPDVAGGARRALGFAATHALSNWLLRAAGWAPPVADDSVGGLDPQPGEKIGMIGLFGSLVPRLVARGARLVVVELRAELHGERDGARVTGDAAELADCTQVLATGTLVLNGSFERMRAACPAARRFVLVGPSAGLLPDALFARGVSALGGTWIVEPAAFLERLVCGQPRGAAARKFMLAATAYPGAPALIERL
ncbi:MAG: hypothetical protein JSR43_13395 [Proteobacteria bacterium]|nr:hypothetical protein [Pseudomonadota bacterium]